MIPIRTSTEDEQVITDYSAATIVTVWVIAAGAISNFVGGIQITLQEHFKPVVSKTEFLERVQVESQ